MISSDVTGQAPVMTQVVVGCLKVCANTTQTINFNDSGIEPAKTPQVFLVN